jgi:NADH:ubiquinone oxidoreductase subunit 6 (subunit J)
MFSLSPQFKSSCTLEALWCSLFSPSSSLKKQEMKCRSHFGAEHLFNSLCFVWFCPGLLTHLPYNFTARSTDALQVNVADIGNQMLSTTEHGYVLPFEVVSMLLLAAMIGCIVIAIKHKPAEI